MICKKCGAYNPDHATFCKVCAANLKDQTDTDEAEVVEEAVEDAELRPQRGKVKAPDFSRRAESFKAPKNQDEPDEVDEDEEEEEKPVKRARFSPAAAPVSKRRILDEEDEEAEEEVDDDYEEEEKPKKKRRGLFSFTDDDEDEE